MEGVAKNEQQLRNDVQENGKGDGKERKETKQEENRETRKGANNKGSERGKKTRGEQRPSEEIPRLVSIEEEKPEEVVVEVEEKKKKKQTKKKDRIKDEIKLILAGIYGAAGALIDECFYLKPHENEMLADAIYRYLEEHNLLDAIREKSATINLIITVLSVNIPKILTYMSKVSKKRKEERKSANDKSREAAENIVRDNGGMQEREFSYDSLKSYLADYYFSGH